MYQMPSMMHVPQRDMRIRRRPFGFRPYGVGFGFPLGFLGGLAAGALIRPPFYPFYPPYPYYGGFWF